MKQHFAGFYEAELSKARQLGVPDIDKLLDRLYVQHFEELTKPLPEFTRDNKDAKKGEEDDLDSSLPAYVEPAVLEGKMAVFYADGNKFGEIVKNAETGDKLKEWDEYIKGERRKLLAAIVKRANGHYHWKTPPVKKRPRTDGKKVNLNKVPHAGRKKIRLEVLLWGGDELIFVVPGWCGMEFAQLFFKATESMKYELRLGKGEEELTHACGMVFCHHQAPISGITKLAKKLADEVKQAFKPEESKGGQINLLNWMVLESFDHAQTELGDLMAARYPVSPPTGQAMSLTPQSVQAMHEHLPKLKEALPRSAIVQTVRLMNAGAAFCCNSNSCSHLYRQLLLGYRNVHEALDSQPEIKDAFNDLWLKLHPLERKWSGKHETGSLLPPATDYPGEGDLDPRQGDLIAWVKLLELWDYCPGLYSSEGDAQ